jgi:ankyrin repeat protein
VRHAKYEEVSSRVQDALELLFNPRKPYLSSWNRLCELDQVLDLGSSRHIEVPSPPGEAALYFAALCGFKEVADYLITHFEVDLADFRHSGAPLHAASSQGHIGVVYLLLQHHVNVNAKCTSQYNWTPLHFASADGYPEVTQLLLERGADIDAPSTNDRTPLSLASQEGHLEVVRLLLSNGADVHIWDKFGYTALRRATERQHVEIEQLLLEYGAQKEVAQNEDLEEEWQ